MITFNEYLLHLFSSVKRVMGKNNVSSNTQCFFYRVPKHGSCHGISRRIQAFYVIKLP